MRQQKVNLCVLQLEISFNFEKSDFVHFLAAIAAL
jgi:hypothetical protein